MSAESDPQTAEILPALAPRSSVRGSFGTFRAVVALVLREMATRYGRSPGGYLWAVLEPLGGILLLGVGMSFVVKVPPLGTSFILFYATGFLPFLAFLQIANLVARSIKYSRPLLFYPRITWVDAILARFTLNALTNLLVAFLLFAILLNVTGARLRLDVPDILVGMGLSLLLGLGVGVFNCAAFGLSPLYENIWTIVTRPLFLLSGVIFLYERLPPIAKDVLWWNPVQHTVGVVRGGFYSAYSADYVNLTYVLGYALVNLFFGVVLMGRYHRLILNDD